MQFPARSLLVALLGLIPYPASADFHVVCPYSPDICREFDSLQGALKAGGTAEGAQLEASLVHLSRKTEELFIEHSENWPLKSDRSALTSVFSDLSALRDGVQAWQIAKGGGAVPTSFLAQEKALDAMFGGIPIGADPGRQEFAGRVASLQEATQNLPGGIAVARIQALRDGLAMLVLVAGAGIDDAHPKTRALLKIAGPSSSGDEASVAGGAGRNHAESVGAPNKGLKTVSVPATGSFVTRIEALPYDARIKAFLKLVAADADTVDVESTIGTLEKSKPVISIGGYKVDDDEAGGYDPSSNSIVLKPGFLTGDISTGSEDALPAGGGMELGLYREVFRDGHKRWHYADTEMAGHLMHEVQHARRHLDGGGANNYTNELDAFNIQNRFYSRLLGHYGDAGSQLSDSAIADFTTWRRSPWTFRDNMVGNYTRHLEIRPGEIRFADQIKGIESRLQKNQNSLLEFAGRPEAVMIQANIDAERLQLKQIPFDQKLSDDAWRYHQKWRLKEGYDRVPLSRDN